MYRKYPKKRGRTFKYHNYTGRSYKRWCISCRAEKVQKGKSKAKALVHLMTRASDEVELEKLEAEMLSALSVPWRSVTWFEYC